MATTWSRPSESFMTAYWSRERPVIWAEAIYTFPLGRVWYVPAKMVEPVFSTVVLTARPITLEGCEK